MAAIVNARDLQLQSVSPRVGTAVLPPNIIIPPTQVDGLPEQYMSTKKLDLAATTQVFVVRGGGTVIDPNSITFTHTLKNITGTPTYSVVSGTATISTVAQGATLTSANLTSAEATIEASITSDSKVYKDRITVVKVTEGSNAVVAFLSNEYATIAATSAGVVVGSYTEVGGKFKVYRGSSDVTGSGVTYSVVTSSGVTISIDSSGTYKVSDVFADTATATLRASYNGTVIDRTYTIVRSRALVSGARGAINISREITGTSWLDSEATKALSDAGYASPRDFDVVTLLNTTAKFSDTRVYSAGSWLPVNAYLNGNMLVDGTVLARHINVTSLSAITSTIGLLRTATSGERSELDNNGLRVYDSLGNLRVRLGVW